MLPAFGLVVLFHYVPIYGLQLAFKRFLAVKGIWASPWTGLQNLRIFFNSASFELIVFNTLSISLYELIAGFSDAGAAGADLPLHAAARGQEDRADGLLRAPFHHRGRAGRDDRHHAAPGVRPDQSDHHGARLRVGVLHDQAGIVQDDLRVLGDLAERGVGLDHLPGGAVGRRPRPARVGDRRRRHQTAPDLAHRPAAAAAHRDHPADPALRSPAERRLPKRCI